MTSTPKTIQIFLPSGDPRGIRIAEITTRILQVIEVPRSLLAEFADMPESKQVAFYFLFGEDDDDELKVYIGQTGDLSKRLAKHNKEKEFWNRAIVVVSRTNSLTQTHAVFLEWFCLQACREAGRYSDENGNSGSRPHTPQPLEADCHEIFDTAKILIATLGFPLFEPVVKPEAKSDEDEVFLLNRPGVDGRGVYTSEGFVVLEGSVGRSKDVPSLATHSYRNLRKDLIKSGVCIVDGERIVFQRDHLFSKPSKAVTALMGRSGNGWTEWRNKDGKSLDKLKRHGGKS